MGMSLSTPTRPLPFTINESKDTKEELIIENLQLVKFLAQRFSSRLPVSVEVDDLISAGVMGLMDAADKFQPERGIKFSTYARQRISGAILDYLREMDWSPRSLRRK